MPAEVAIGIAVGASTSGMHAAVGGEIDTMRMAHDVWTDDVAYTISNLKVSASLKYGEREPAAALTDISGVVSALSRDLTPVLSLRGGDG